MCATCFQKNINGGGGEERENGRGQGRQANAGKVNNDLISVKSAWLLIVLLFAFFGQFEKFQNKCCEKNYKKNM